ncbi:hypothetical protein ES703_78269 [subsurface metagenome]
MGSGFAIHFQKERPRNARDVLKNDKRPALALYEHMIPRGFAYVTPGLPHCFLAEPHTEEDVDEYLAASEEFFSSYSG